jgi:AraC-like DNA-binding protein
MREDLRFLRTQSGAVWLHEPHGKLHFWHHHDELEFNLVAKGTARYLLDDRRYDLGPGCLVWLFPDQEHLLVDLSPDFAAWMGVITPQTLRTACAGAHKDLRSGDPPGNFCRRLGATDTAFLSQLCRDLLPPLPVQDPARFAAGLGYLFLSAWTRFQAATDTVVGTEAHPAVERAAGALERGEESLEAIARAAGLSYSQLSRIFHRQAGQTLVAYRAHARVRRFLALHQRNTRASLLSLALKAGFGSYAQFHRTFRASMGLTPRTWLGRAAIGDVAQPGSRAQQGRDRR